MPSDSAHNSAVIALDERKKTVINALIAMAERNVGLLHAMVDPLPEEKIVRQHPGIVNHPLWSMGHLMVTRAALSRILGEPYPAPQGWEALFGQGSKPLGDAKAYPSKGEVLKQFDAAHRHLMGVLKKSDWESLSRPHGIAPLAAMFPTTQDLLMTLLGPHDGIHAGQISDWRRIEGYPSVI